MARTPSNMLPLGTPAPSFELLDTISDKTISIENLRGENGTLIAFICNHCPFVIHINNGMIKLANTYQEKGIGFVAISSNDVENYPQDGPLEMKLQAQKLNYPFPYLFDETQSVAKAFDPA